MKVLKNFEVVPCLLDTGRRGHSAALRRPTRSAGVPRSQEIAPYRTPQYEYALAPVVFLGGKAVSCERGSPVDLHLGSSESVSNQDLFYELTVHICLNVFSEEPNLTRKEPEGASFL